MKEYWFPRIPIHRSFLQRPEVFGQFLLRFMSLKRLDQFNLAHQILSDDTVSL